VEGPSVVKHGGYYYIFYSGNMYNTDKYAVGVARSRSPTGPYEKAPTPILQSSPNWVGPGHGGPANVNGESRFVYHAWPKGRVGEARMVLSDKLQWVDGWPKIGNGMPSGAPPAASPAPGPH
jgi:beta-xylosidase